MSTMVRICSLIDGGMATERMEAADSEPMWPAAEIVAHTGLRLEISTSPEELKQAVARFQHWYNHERYHEVLGNLRAVDV